MILVHAGDKEVEVPNGIHLHGLKFHVEIVNVGGLTIELMTGTFSEKDRLDVKSWVTLVLQKVGGLRHHPVRNAKVSVFLTRFKKRMQSHRLPLGQFEVNSGYCYAFNEIVIYREEDWRKVFIHETFHLFGFDELAKGDLSHLFPIPSMVDVKEVFCETNARILYCKWLNLPLQKEVAFSTSQMVKVLKHYGLTFKNVVLRSNLNKFVERSNVFAYYVVPAILLNDVDNFNAASAALFSGEAVDLVALIRSAMLKMRPKVAPAETAPQNFSLKMVGGNYIQKHKWKRAFTATRSSYTKRRSRRSRLRVS